MLYPTSLRIKMTPEQHLALRKLAAKRLVSMSQLVRGWIIRAAIDELGENLAVHHAGDALTAVSDTEAQR